MQIENELNEYNKYWIDSHKIILRKGIEFDTIDVIICVHNAIEDVKECINSLIQNKTYPYNIIIVDDGSDEITNSYLKEVSKESNIKLIRNNISKGYTVAANQGLKQSTSKFVVLLNSDTIVTLGWLEKMVECFNMENTIGILGPLSNAATYQSVPEITENGKWKINELPPKMTVDMMNILIEKASEKIYPEVSVINGFCFMIKRDVLDKIGFLDEDRFPMGYGEENDYCIRAKKAGFKLRILDNTYIYHKKSKSFTLEKRDIMSKNATAILKEKYSEMEIKKLNLQMKSNKELNYVRENIKKYLTTRWDKYKKLMDKKILFILPVKGGSGGANSVVQEVLGLRKLGIDVDVITHSKKIKDFNSYYPEAKEYTKYYNTENALVEISQNYHIIIGTIFTSIKLVSKIKQANKNIITGYYVQDYEPYFFDSSNELKEEAINSYTLIDNNHLFAKTNWIIDTINKYHNITVSKVEPSLDIKFYNPYLIQKKELTDKIIISAMIRTTTPRRQPKETLEILSLLKEKYKDNIQIMIFGSETEQINEIYSLENIKCKNYGILKRWEVANILINSDVFIDMSTYQAFGRTGLESMAVGCIPILPKEGGIYEYAIDGLNSCIVDTSNIKEAYSSICNLIDNEEKILYMRKEGLKTARKYSILNSSYSEIDFFNELIVKDM